MLAQKNLSTLSCRVYEDLSALMVRGNKFVFMSDEMHKYS
jgi:hypothetical protein